jgi:hypothetical protein
MEVDIFHSHEHLAPGKPGPGSQLGRAHRIEEAADLCLELAAVGRQRLRGGEHLR